MKKVNKNSSLDLTVNKLILCLKFIRKEVKVIK